ncbi:hypothetical protein C8R47DRAFT_983362 [Mycena vitilis]|nr:hypothetical protein C8R47DRAFT_983362 [Mycena vitilis]
MECLIRIGSVPAPTVVNRGGTIFVAYNCDAEKIPPSAWDYVDKVWYYSTRTRTKDNGFSEDMEWAKEMDWHKPDRDWTAWIPVKGSAELPDLPWYHLEDDPDAIKMTQYGRYLLEPTVRDAVLADLKPAWELVHAISHIPQFPPNMPGPVEYSSREIYLAKDSRKEIMEVFAGVKRKMLEYLGWVYWWSSVEDRWEELVSSQQKDLISSYRLQEYGKRGLILNLARDFPTINLPMLLEHNVPFAYAWTVREDVHPRFARLAPTLIKAYLKKRQQVGADFYAFDDEGRKSELFRYLFDYDPYFQALPPEFIDAPELAPTQLRENWAYFMIDGDGYGRRNVPEPEWRHYYALRYCYRVFSNPDSSHSTVVFYRQLQKVIQVRPKFKVLVGGMDEASAALEKEVVVVDDDDDDFGYIFNDDVVPAPAVPSSSAKSLLLRLSSPGVEPKEEGNPKVLPLLARLTDREDSRPLVPSEPLRMRGPGRELSRSRNSSVNSSLQGSRDRYGSGGPSSRDRSRSPMRNAPAASLPPRRRSPDQTRMQAYRKPSVEQEARMLEWLASDVLWDRRFLDKAFLLLQDAPSRVWARYLATSDPAPRTAEDLLNRLIDYGVAFRLAVREDDIRLFRPAEMLIVERKWGASSYSTNVREDPLTYGSGGREFVERWHKRCKEIFTREHARALVSMGGVFSWLALSYSRDSLVPAFKNGPSKQITVYRRGWTDVADSDSLYLVSDEMSADEVDLLLGKLHGEEKFIWPKNEFLWDLSAHFSGAFNPGWLSTFKVIEGELERFEPRHRTRGEFRELFRRANRTDQMPVPKKVTREDFEEEDVRMDSLFVDSWAKICVRNVLLPGVFRNIQTGV